MRLALPTALVVLAGCATASVSSSAWTPGPARPPSGAPVRLSFLADVAGAEEVGVVEANGRVPPASLDALLAELRSRAASIGADLVRVDRFGTRYELVDETYTYDCSVHGTAGAPCACGTRTVTTAETRFVTRTDPDGSTRTESETVTVTKEEPTSCTATRQVEVATASFVGRAFRAGGGSP